LNKKTIRDVDVFHKRVLVRVDLNVPFLPGTTSITDDTRIRAIIPTVSYLRDRGARIILCSHLGRPKGRVLNNMRMRPIVERLAQLLEQEVLYVSSCVGAEVQEAVRSLSPGGVILLENLRFHKEEEENDHVFASSLASLADLYVNDAFGSAHRAHASTQGVTRYIPGVAGFLVEQEVKMLGDVLDEPKRPLCAVMGGAKVSDKIGVLNHMLQKVDQILIGGGMAATFLRSLGNQVGASMIEEDKINLAKEIMGRVKGLGISLRLPEDVVVAETFSSDSICRVVTVDQIPDGWHIMDIGPKTIGYFQKVLDKSRTIIWNGPLGVMEYPLFTKGTITIAKHIASLRDIITIVGGGSTAEAVTAMGLSDRMTHVSTGGGASLEFLKGHDLPGITALLDKEIA
jgi:phosphoglycerate kinase